MKSLSARNSLQIAILSTAALLAGPASAQEERVEPLDATTAASRQMTLFSGSSFNGPSLGVTGPRAVLALPYRVRSVIIQPGERWQLCSQTQFRNCQTYTGRVQNVQLTVASARPVRPVVLPPVGGGQSLRGMASEYFPAPRENGQRVEVRAGTAAAAAQRADRFCARSGWVGSAHERLQTVSGRVYLADVLCVRSGS